MMSGVLYTARNERFHGDNFSHFKSSLSSIKTYGHFLLPFVIHLFSFMDRNAKVESEIRLSRLCYCQPGSN